jgi:hypothetical protein
VGSARGRDIERESKKTMANQLGKRYQCETCGTEVLCNKPGAGSVTCCDKEMKLKEAKPLPSSD